VRLDGALGRYRFQLWRRALAQLKNGQVRAGTQRPRDTELKAEIGAAELNGAVAEAKAAG
jgi:hypothetical protein